MYSNVKICTVCLRLLICAAAAATAVAATYYGIGHNI